VKDKRKQAENFKHIEEEANKVYTDLKKDYPTSQLASPNYQNGQVIGAEIDKYIERTK